MPLSRKRDCYETLGVPSDASTEAVEAAFRSVVLRDHPEHSDGSSKSQERFRQAAEAFKVLRDERLRGIYDTFGWRGLEEFASGFDEELDLSEGLEILHRHFGDVAPPSSRPGESFATVEQVVAETTPAEPRPSTEPAEAEDGLRVPIEISLQEVATGIRHPIRVPCPECDGIGEVPSFTPVECGHCSGTGRVRKVAAFLLGPPPAESICPHCNGSGERLHAPCPTCDGTGQDADRAAFVEVPPGVMDGEVLRARLEGQEAAEAPEILVDVHVEPNAVFLRDGADLHVDLPLSNRQAAEGGPHEVQTLEGGASVEVPEGSGHGDILRLEGQGLPRRDGSGRGDLLVRLTVVGTKWPPASEPDERPRRRARPPWWRRHAAAIAVLGIAVAAAAAYAVFGGSGSSGGMSTMPPDVLAAAEREAASAAAGTEPSSTSVGGDEVVSGTIAGPPGTSGAEQATPAGSAGRADGAGRDVPATIVALDGSGQQGAAGEPLPDSLAVRVLDGGGLPVAGAVVTFSVVSGNGSVSPRRATTNADGVARSQFTLGRAGELDAAMALVEGSTIPEAMFTAGRGSPRAGELAAIGDTAVTGISGRDLDPPVRVRVLDTSGAPLEGATVWFRVEAGDGDVSPARTTTDRNGVARVTWSLGSTGKNVLRAGVVGAPDLRIHANAAPPALAIRPGLVSGGTHTCRLQADGTSICWGGNADGQIGDGTPRRQPTPAPVSGHLRLAVLSAGIAYTCGIAQDGTGYCWGANGDGQLGDGTTTQHDRPTPIDGVSGLVRISAGSSHTCAIDHAGVAYCWGSNVYGQLGDGTRGTRTSPVQVKGGASYRGIVLGWSHTCGLTTDGQALCWGRNAFGQLGTGGTEDAPVPQPVSGGHSFRSLVAGASHTCGLTGDGHAYCWGQNTYGQLGDGTHSNRGTPVLVQGDLQFATLTAGSVHTCGVTSDGRAFCWGRNVHGQLGIASTEDQSVPTAVAGDVRFSTIRSNGAHTCGTSVDGRDYCWGYNIDGQLGDGTRTDRTRPVAVVHTGSS